MYMKKMTVVMVAGCLLSGVVFLTGNSVFGQDAAGADANADKDKAPKAGDHFILRLLHAGTCHPT